MEATVYSQEGKETGKITIPESVFDLPWNGDLVHQVMVSLQSSARIPYAHVKDRSDVSGGGKKPWQQKGTGRARHGSSRSPIWRSGGATHGPSNERNFTKKINKKMRTKAFLTILSEKYRNGEIVFVDKIAMESAKTAGAKKVLATLDAKLESGMLTKKKNSTLVTTLGPNETVFKSLRNFSNIEVSEVRNLGVLELLNHKYLLITEPEGSMQVIEHRATAGSTAR